VCQTLREHQWWCGVLLMAIASGLEMIASDPEMITRKMRTVARGENLDARRATATAWPSTMIARRLRGSGRDLGRLRPGRRWTRPGHWCLHPGIRWSRPPAGERVLVPERRVLVADERVLVAGGHVLIADDRDLLSAGHATDRKVPS
jgi:hypothetical protein